MCCRKLKVASRERSCSSREAQVGDEPRHMTLKVEINKGKLDAHHMTEMTGEGCSLQ